MKIRELAKLTLDRAMIPTNTICIEPECVWCNDARIRNNDDEKNRCDVCYLPKFMCTNHGKSGLLSMWKKFKTFEEVLDSKEWQLMAFILQRLIKNENCTTTEYVTKAEELGLGEMVSYWKIQLLDEKIEKIKTKLNELIALNNKQG